MKHKPLWMEEQTPALPRISDDCHFDVLVLGGGLTGLTVAYLLTKSGKRVAVLERDRIASGDTGHTTAHLTYVTDLRLGELVRRFGQDAAQLVWRGGSAAINMIEAIVTTENIECDFRRVPGFLHASLLAHEDEQDELEAEATLARELGFEALFVPHVPVVCQQGICFANQAQFHATRYLKSLVQLIQRNGSEVFEQSEVTAVEDDPLAVSANEHRVSADYLVIATHVPLLGNTGIVRGALFQSKIAPYTSYVLGARAPKGTFPEACFWDTSDPYYYLRITQQPDHDYLIFGGEDHKTGQAQNAEERYGRLTEILYGIVPQADIDRSWSGQVIEPHDGLPLIGETADRQFVATGFSGNGFTFGTLAAIMACDSVFGRSNPWQDIFAVSRKPWRGGVWNYVKENLDYPYFLVKDRISAADGAAVEEIAPGDGKVLRLNGRWTACHRDEQGELQQVSAICTHLGCVVHWNNAERTWDCPCHGSRFDTTGAVIAGPAESPLEAARQGANQR
jgi:glycine/D-amino acid oxidase-like deaminating enzyme/nitrite reductase/ring-hydroxylating ferredoxin subunit